MYEAVKILHFFALLLGGAAGLGGYVIWLVTRNADQPPAPVIGGIRKTFMRTGLAGILLIWISGLYLVGVRYGGWVDGALFSTKIAFASVLLALSILVNAMVWRAGKAATPPPKVLLPLGLLALPLLLGALVFAVLTFTA